MAKIDELDIKIIRELKRDARTSYREIAERLGVAEGTVYNRIHKLKEIGAIRRFIPDIDYSKLGY
ncbi:MAG: Lrp/AsnC family transcriptional regulator, partial [Candidatus Syntropharchaeia archaeon]